MKKYLVSVAVALVAPLLFSTVAFASTAFSLTTLFAQNNSLHGNMFDVTTGNDPIEIDGFDINRGIRGIVDDEFTMEVYYREDSYSGHVGSLDGWILLGTANVTMNAADTPTSLPIGGLKIPANSTYGLYVTSTGGKQYLGYTGWSGGPGSMSWSDGNITITCGIGRNYNTNQPISKRAWNGTVYYHVLINPGHEHGKKTGWDGSNAPGLEQNGKSPAGILQGNKTGWDVEEE